MSEFNSYEFSVNSGLEIDPKLRRFVNEESLLQNALRYPEMRDSLSERQVKNVARIKGVLRDLPLIHATKKPIATDAKIMPANQVEDSVTKHTHDLDKSLGLDSYVFFNWGLPEKSNYGRNFLLIPPADILNSDNTLVTPGDIGNIKLVGNTTFDDLAPEDQERYRRGYFDKMVTGKAWAEIISRRILKGIEQGDKFVNLHSRGTLGEIKHLGPVSGKLISGNITDQQFNEYYKFLYEHGFCFDNMELKRRLFLRTGKKQGIDPLPEECGVDYDKATAFWQERLA